MLYNHPHSDAPLSRGGVCMKGNIYPTKTGYQVRFGRKITRRFKRGELALAERFLNGLRFKTDEGTFDARDYQQSNPLGFSYLVEKYLKAKAHLKAVKKYEQRLRFAVEAWDARNVKEIKYADIEDLINSLRPVKSPYYIKHIRDTLRQFFNWLVDRGELNKAPKMPPVKAAPGLRKIMTKDQQSAVLGRIYEITKDFNPRIHLAVQFLATYVNLRPAELLSVKEKAVDYERGVIFIEGEDEKTGAPKVVYLLDEDVAALKALGPSFPELFVFRHIKGSGAARPGAKFGPDYLQRWWNKACKYLGISGVSLYPGTRHSSVVHLRESYSPESIKRATGHKTNSAFDRYLQVSGSELRAMYARSKSANTDQQVINIFDPTRRKNS